MKINSVSTLGKGVVTDSGAEGVEEMQNRPKPPPSLTDFKGNPPRVTFTHAPKDEADSITTLALLNHFIEEDGFHCPRCGVVIKNPEDSVIHLGEEINKALAHLGK